MRVALLDPSLFTWPYDAALALALQARGHELAIFGKPLPQEDAGPAYALLRQHFYTELDSPVAKRLPRGMFLAWKGVLHVRAMRALLAELRRFQPDVIHVQWSPLPIVDRWYIRSLRAIAPLVMTVHDPVPYNGSPRAYVQRLSAVAIMRHFARLIVHTERACQRLSDYGLAPAKIRRIPHGPMGVAPVLEAGAVRARPEAAPVQVLLFGRIKHYKGVDVLVQAAAQMRPEILRQCQIRIVGQPFMDLAPIERAIAAHALTPYVKLEPRFVAEADVAELFAGADVIVLPYREIDASGVLMSCLSAGLPVIASRIGLFAELLEDGRHGRLVEVGDAAGLARALEALIADGALRERMAAEVRTLRAGIPEWAEIAELTERLYLELRQPLASGTSSQVDRPRRADLASNY